MLVIFNVIYDNLCDCLLFQGQGAIICIYIVICMYNSVIVFLFLYFKLFFIGERQNLTISFTFWLYIC